MNESPDRYAQWDAAYVLGALSVAERREFEDHLAECSACQRAVSELVGMPGLLAQVPAADAVALSDPGMEDLPPSLVSKVIRRRASDVRRGWLTAAALVLTLLIGGAVGYLIHGAQPGQPDAAPTASAPNPRRLAFVPVRPSSMTAVVDVVKVGSGTELRVECQYGSGGSHNPSAYAEYAIYVVDRSGDAVRAKTWKAKPDKVMTPTATSPLRPDQIAAIEIRTVESDTTLMRARLG